jgi:hypothetical protein
MTSENNVVLVDQQWTRKAKLMEAFDQPADLLCGMGSGVFRMRFDRPDLTGLKLSRMHWKGSTSYCEAFH